MEEGWTGRGREEEDWQSRGAELGKLGSRSNQLLDAESYRTI